MLTKPLLFTLIFAPLALSQAERLKQGHLDMDASIRPGCPNAMQVEPVVIYNVSGGTLLGPVQYHLVVYNNGMAAFARPADDPREGAQPVAAFTHLSINEVNQLVADLRRCDADTLCDQEAYVTDCPLQTLTVMEGRPDAVAHTFSYWAGIGSYAGVASVMDNFVEAYFAEL